MISFDPVAGVRVTRQRVLTVTATSVPAWRRVVVLLSVVGMRADEVVHDGGDFTNSFLDAPNTRSAIADGYEYEILRDGGWVGDVTITVIGITTAGLVETASATWPT